MGSYDDLENGCGVDNSWIFYSILGTVLVLVFIFMFVAADTADKKSDTNIEKIMRIPELNINGTVIGIDRGKMYKMRLDTGAIILISVNQVEPLPEKKSDKEIMIEKLKNEIEEKKKELNRIEGK